MASPTWTQTDLDNVTAAIASGALSVEIDGQRVTYRSMNDLILAKNVIEQFLNSANPPIRMHLGSPRTGF
jgi:hypothetical protein